MASFDFITSQNFRSSLEADYGELRKCLEAGALKAAHVLAGSIIEALLSDYLVSMEAMEEDDVAKLGLAQLVEAAEKRKLISKKVADLSSAIRGYRNLIHPGRAVRTAETVDEHSAEIAARLVELIVMEVAAQKQASYGFTAEQIVNKLQRDSSATAILDHLLREARAAEIRRLLLDVLPTRILETDGPFDAMEDNLEECYTAAFKLAEQTLKKDASLRYVHVLQQESDSVIQSFDWHFFQMEFLDHLEPSQAKLIRQHLCAVLSQGTMFSRAQGLGQRLEADELTDFVDPLVRVATQAKHKHQSEPAERYLSDELIWMNDDIATQVRKRLQQWKKTFESRKQPIYANVVRRVLGEEEVHVTPFDEDDDLPF